jgi:hypothetical protein
MSQQHVRSEPIAPARQRTALIRRGHAAWLLKWVVRLSASVVLYGSWLGTAMLLAGTVPTSWWDLRSLPASAIWWGLAIQAPITLAEFANRHRRATWSYRAPLIVDILSTFLGYRPIVVPWLQTALIGSGQSPNVVGETGALVVTHLAALFLSWFVAQFPEMVLVDD